MVEIIKGKKWADYNCCFESVNSLEKAKEIILESEKPKVKKYKVDMRRDVKISNSRPQ